MEYFIVANSFAAPFVSDQSEHFEEAKSPRKALEAFAGRYSHPARLFAADCYASATDYHKGKPALARWLCNHEIARQKATKGKGCHSYTSLGPGRLKIDDELIVIPEPFKGKLVPVPSP
jgi:hypothetical protein